MRVFAALAVCTGLLLSGCSNGDNKAQSNDADKNGSSSQQSGTNAAAEETGGNCEATTKSANDPAAGADTSPEVSEALLKTAKLEGKGTNAPTLKFDVPMALGAEAVVVSQPGKGEVLTDGQILTINYMVCDAVTGEKLFSSWGKTSDKDEPVAVPFSEATFGPTVAKALADKKVGTRFLWGQPGYTAEKSPSGKAVNGIIYVMSIDGAQSLLKEAKGKEVKPSDASLPVITMVDGKPSVEFPKTFADPKELIVQPLIEGDGATVKEGQTVAVKYSGWLKDGTKFDSSWDREAPNDVFMFKTGSGQVIKGWDQGLVGQKVGSRVLLVVPSELGYGKDGSGEKIPGNSTLVFVVDILGAF